MLKLRLIRHPKPQVAAGICYGSTDLLAEDEALAAQLQHCLALEPPEILLSSPLVRCAALSHSLAHRPDSAQQAWPMPIIHAHLAEMHFGEWEMRPWAEIPRDQINAWVADISGYAPPGGESVRAVAERASQAIAAALSPILVSHTERVTVICHSGVMQGLSHLWSGKLWSEFKPLNLAYGQVMEFALRLEQITPPEPLPHL